MNNPPEIWSIHWMEDDKQEVPVIYVTRRDSALSERSWLESDMRKVYQRLGWNEFKRGAAVRQQKVVWAEYHVIPETNTGRYMLTYDYSEALRHFRNNPYSTVMMHYRLDWDVYRTTEMRRIRVV